MTTTATEHADRSSQIITSVSWNGQPFQLVEKPSRSMRIVRIKRVPPEMRHRFNRQGWPRNMVIGREHTLTLAGEEIELMILTNAEEAEDELPDEIVTNDRDIGTFRDATVIWRRRAVRSVVSARLRAQLAMMPAQDDMSAHFPPEVYLSLLNTLKGGIIVPRATLPDALTPDEKVLVNLLITARSDGEGASLTLREIGTILNVSDETVRRRRAALEENHPRLKSVIASFRPRGAGLSAPAGIVMPRHEHDPSEDE